MNIRQLKNVVLRGKNQIALFNYRVFRKTGNESVYFYTFHKCASTLFSEYVLKNADGLYHLDFDSEIYSGTRPPHKPIRFEKTGYIYGPIRMTSGSNYLAKKRLVIPATQVEFIRNKTALFLIRDPRDILVSAYYSFGFIHSPSVVGGIARKQESLRQRISQMTVDEYVLNAAEEQNDAFALTHKLVSACKRHVVLRYEDMIHDFDNFASNLTQYVDFSPATLREIYQRSRPRSTEDLGSHHRSGKTGGFRDKLQPDTIMALNQKLSPILKLFDYGV